MRSSVRVKLGLAVLAGMLTIGGCGKHELSAEQVAQVQQLRADGDKLRKEIAAGEAEHAKYDGGLLKVLIATRLEVSKTTLALIDQRIHAIESGSPVTISTAAVTPDEAKAAQVSDEITKEEAKLADAQKEVAKYSGGLLQVMAMTTVATEQQTLAMLRQQMLSAKFGLAIPKVEAASSSASTSTPASAPAPTAKPDPTQNVANQIVVVKLVRKSAQKGDYQDFELLDLQFTASGLDKKARAIKGVLNFTDLFDDPKFHLNWSIDKPIGPGETQDEKGGGFKYNQFNDAQQWVRTTDLSDMKVSYTVKSILYEDGTRRDME